MKISIGDKNKIEASAIGQRNSVKPKKDKGGIIKDIVTGLVVTVIGGIILALIIGLLNID